MHTRLLLFAAVVLSSATLCLQARPQNSSEQAPTKQPTLRKSPATQHRTSSATKTRRPKRAVSPRVRRVHSAFVASSDLKPMARQLLDDRTRAAYAGVEAYARKHVAGSAGALANLALGYAHVLDHEPAKAIAPLTKARTHAGELEDYVAYWLGAASNATGDSQHAIATLSDFSTRYPDSLLRRDAAVVYAGALTAADRPGEAVAVLEKYQTPPRADVQLAMGRAWLKAGENQKAAAVLQHLYLTVPLAPEAVEAGSLLRALPEVPAPSFAQLKTRADLLAQGRRYTDAAAEYRTLLSHASEADRPALELALAGALHRSGGDNRARSLLEQLTVSGELNAERLFYLAEIARSDGDEDRFIHTIADLRAADPASPWLQQALLTAGNFYLLRNDYDRAIDFYRELRDRFPQDALAPYANWKVAWLNLRQGRNDEAKRGFEDQIARYPGSAQIPAALYWRARLAEDNGETLLARQYYQKLSDRFRYYYYADLARERLQRMAAASTGDVRGVGLQADASDALLQKIAPLSLPAKVSAAPAPADNLRVQKALLLDNGGLTDLAVRELQASDREADGDWATAAMARLYRDDGYYHRALQLLKRAVPSYLALDVEVLPRDYWEFLFPRPYWSDLKKFSAANQLDPYLVASLIRQESEFNAAAISHANAYGLMQVLPASGRKLARDLRVPRYSTARLLTPATNLQLGSRYLREMLDHFNGQVEYALAAYNAGSDRVEAWLGAGKYRDPQEFVESIPFTETREYVQSVLRNASMYRRLYGAP